MTYESINNLFCFYILGGSTASHARCPEISEAGKESRKMLDRLET